MNDIYKHSNFKTVNKEFQDSKNDTISDCPWAKFIPIHKDISRGKCPICEQELDKKNERDTGSSIDHFRPKRNELNSKQPKDVYAFLECDESNYILMCKECNDVYKKSYFPLDTNFVAKKLSELSDEKPLLLNVREEDPLDYFELVFTQRYLPLPILELKRKKCLLKSSYEYRKSEKTIKIFGLGKCHKLKQKGKSKSVYNMLDKRIFILALHYDALYDLAKAIDEKKDFEEILKNNPKLIEYGFFRFLINQQFKIE